MTDDEVREAIAAAASTVDGVDVSAWPRQSTKPGDGFVAFRRAERDTTGLAFINKWEVFVMLPAGLKDAEKKLSALADPLVKALQRELVVTTFYPTDLALGTKTVPCVVIEGSRARD